MTKHQTLTGEWMPVAGPSPKKNCTRPAPARSGGNSNFEKVPAWMYAPEPYEEEENEWNVK